MKNCLTCKYEPEWNEPVGNDEYKRQTGNCRYPMMWPKMPWIYVVQKRPLIRYSDDSGLPTSCATWEKKEV